MTSQRYERVAGNDDDEPQTPNPSGDASQPFTPSSPPPSFRSRASSPSSRRLLENDPLSTDADRALADTFNSPDGDDSDSEAEGEDDRRGLVRHSRSTSQEQSTGQTTSQGQRPLAGERRVTELPVLTTASAPTGRVYGGGSRSTNDGVFANLDAKPELGEKSEELPPSYEQAAADATPPYWETTILAPGMGGSDEVYIDGLPVGSVFSFVWNGMISMSFQIVGFLLTYLLHTTHAAKNGSKAGLGVFLVQYGFYMKSSGADSPDAGVPGDAMDPAFGTPPDPNSHNFGSATEASAAAAVAAMANAQASESAKAASTGVLSSITSSDWLAYLLMIVGWFIIGRAVANFLRARRHEQLVLQSPDRGLGVPVVAEGEQAETVV